MSKLRNAARDLLIGFAYDHAKGATGGWEWAKRIERRFNLGGFTVARIELFEDTAKLNRAMDSLRGLAATFEPTEIQLICASVARQDLADLARVRGEDFIRRHA